MSEFRFEPLGEKLNICVSNEHSFGTDAFLLSAFASPKKSDVVYDLGTGCGIIPVLWYRTTPPKKVFAVDVQPQAIEQLEITVKENALEGFSPICADLKELKPVELADVVTCNPPYKATGTGIVSELTAEQIARHEVLCNIYDVTDAAARLLKFGGRLCICQRPERLCDVISAMKKSGIEPKRLRFVQKNSDSAPWLFLIEGKKGSKPFLTVEKPFLINEGSEPSEETKKLYRPEG